MKLFEPIRWICVFAIVSLFFSGLPNCVAVAAARHAQSSGKINLDKETDPCEQALVPQGNAYGLKKRCETEGTGGAAKGDFNGDGFADLAVGAPHEDLAGIGGVGAVNIIFGSAAGLTSTGNQELDERNFGVSPASGDHFGSALAAGDFNGDGFSDLAIGAPDNNAFGTNAGLIVVINGSSTGLNTATARQLPFFGEVQERVGAVLTWADFDGDGFADLAIGDPDEDADCGFLGTAIVSAGRVVVFFGSSAGLLSSSVQRFVQCSGNPADIVVGDMAERGDEFGAALAAADFNGDGFADLAIGVPGESLGFGSDKEEAGMVQILHGSPIGLNVRNGVQTISQDTSGVGGAGEKGDQFGRVMNAGDFNGDGRDDLVVGVPFEDLSSNNAQDAGDVQVFPGIGGGGAAIVSTSNSVFISQAELSGVSVEGGDRFGWSLAVGDFDADGREDLAVGAPGEDIGSNPDAGIVSVLYGTSSGLSLTRTQNWSQDSAGVPDFVEGGDQFGYALSAWNYGFGRESDLAIGVPFEDLSPLDPSVTIQLDAGAVTVIYGSPGGLSTSAHAAQLWTQDSPGIRDSVEGGDRFGEALY